VGGLAAETDDRTIALIGKNHPGLAVMADTGNDDLAMVGTHDAGAAHTHVAGLLDGLVRVAEIAAPVPTVTTATVMAPATIPATIPATAAITIMNDNGAAGAADGKFETNAACIGGRRRSCNPGSGDNEGGECIADKAVHGFSPDAAAQAP
tara:strand:+ start:14206 stop:14658 length:453 start_codon:yes stop_codon:yes gene_type:complete